MNRTPQGTLVAANMDLITYRPRYRRDVVRDGWLTWSWRIVDEAISPHPVIESGTALTGGSAWRRVDRAHKRLLDGAR